MLEEKVDLVCEGDYVIVKRHNFTKLHQVSLKANLMLGKDKVDISCIIGKPVWTMYRMVPKKNSKREYSLEVCSKVESIESSVMKDLSSGVDNRHITNDNKSQLLSTEEINDLRESGLSSCGIVSALIENSTTFKNKTEYSQAKYLKKKEKKYHEYITVRKPSIRLLAQILFNKDQFKILGLRYDSLSQILTAANIQPGGVYLLFENGSQGLVAATILNQLSESSILINLTMGNHPQKQAVLAMNFSKSKLNVLLNVKISSLVDILKKPEEKDCGPSVPKSNETVNSSESPETELDKCLEEETDSGIADVETRKRKLETDNGIVPKKPRWAEELQRAADILTTRKTDAFIIASKEYPLELLDCFIEYVKSSRPLIIYSVYREPLVALYVELKKRKNVVGLHLTEMWLREYQVLPDRTHPHVTMSPSGGFILTAIIV